MTNKNWGKLHQTDNTDKSFYVAFFKKRPPIQGRAALGRSSQRAKLSLRRFFGSFFAATCSKKERNDLLQCKKKKEATLRE